MQEKYNFIVDTGILNIPACIKTGSQELESILKELSSTKNAGIYIEIVEYRDKKLICCDGVAIFEESTK